MNKVIHVIKTYFPETQGGMEEVARQITNVAIKNGYACEIVSFSSNFEDIIVFDNVKIHRFKYDINILSTPIILKNKIIKRIVEILNTADIIHYHYPWPFMDYIDRFVNSSIKRITTYHSDALMTTAGGIVEKFYNDIINKKFMKSQDVIVATSQNYLDSSQYLSRYKNKVKIIPLGLNDSALDSKSKSIYEDFFNIPYVFFIGVLRHYKGLKYLIESAIKIAPIKIIIAGSGPEEKLLKQKIHDENITNVEMLGKISNDEKYQLMKHSIAVVLPSIKRSEAFGVTLLEAAMLGKPMISTDLHTGTSFVNVNDYTGYVVKPKCSEALSEAIIKIFNEKINKKFSQNSREYFLNNFESSKTNFKYIKLYNNLLEQS
jgi:rhamnosyl/mannosyltransferase